MTGSVYDAVDAERFAPGLYDDPVDLPDAFDVAHLGPPVERGRAYRRPRRRVPPDPFVDEDMLPPPPF